MDQEALGLIELAFLPLLDRFSNAYPRSLSNRLATDPQFFVDIIRMIYRSDKASDANEDARDSGANDEGRKQLVRSAYKLLMEWRQCPGTDQDDNFNAQRFRSWLAKVKELTTESGHLRSALFQIGEVLTNAPEDPDGLWIHTAAAEALNDRSAERMRERFTKALFSQWGVHLYTKGQEERELAERYCGQAKELDQHSFAWFAAAMRRLASGYEMDAAREEKRNPFGD